MNHIFINFCSLPSKRFNDKQYSSNCNCIIYISSLCYHLMFFYLNASFEIVGLDDLNINKNLLIVVLGFR